MGHADVPKESATKNKVTIVTKLLVIRRTSTGHISADKGDFKRWETLVIFLSASTKWQESSFKHADFERYM